MPHPHRFHWKIGISRTQMPTPPPQISLKNWYFSYPNAYPPPTDFIEHFVCTQEAYLTPTDFIETSVSFVPKCLPHPHRFPWQFCIFRTQKLTPSPRDFIENSIFFVPKGLHRPLGILLKFLQFSYPNALEILQGAVGVNCWGAKGFSVGVPVPYNQLKASPRHMLEIEKRKKGWGKEKKEKKGG